MQNSANIFEVVLLNEMVEFLKDYNIDTEMTAGEFNAILRKL